MHRQRLFLSGLFSLVAGFGLWTVAAVSFQGVSGTFADGVVLTAQDLNSLFDAIDANFVAAEAQINANESAIEANAASLTTNTAAIALNAANISDHATQLGEHAASIETNSATITANTTAIDANTSAIGSNATGIASNASAIVANETAIAALESGKVAKAGDSITGRLEISGDTGPIDSTYPAGNAALYVGNTNAHGVSNRVESQFMRRPYQGSRVCRA